MNRDDYARIKAEKWASDDDAQDLLAGILDETAANAEEEQRRIEAELRAREEAEREQRLAEEERRRAEAQARLSAEMERLEKVAVRRTQKMEALRIEDLKERGEWQDPAQAVQESAAGEPAPVEQPVEQPVQRHVEPLAAPEPLAPRSNLVPVLALVTVLVLVMGAGAVAFMLVGRYQVDVSTYSKAVYTPKDTRVAMVEKSIMPIPQAAPAAAAATVSAGGTSKPARANKAPRAAAAQPSKPISAKPEQNEANERVQKLDQLLEADPFQADF